MKIWLVGGWWTHCHGIFLSVCLSNECSRYECESEEVVANWNNLYSMFLLSAIDSIHHSHHNKNWKIITKLSELIGLQSPILCALRALQRTRNEHEIGFCYSLRRTLNGSRVTWRDDIHLVLIFLNLFFLYTHFQYALRIYTCIGRSTAYSLYFDMAIIIGSRSNRFSCVLLLFVFDIFTCRVAHFFASLRRLRGLIETLRWCAYDSTSPTRNCRRFGICAVSKTRTRHQNRQRTFIRTNELHDFVVCDSMRYLILYEQSTSLQ